MKCVIVYLVSKVIYKQRWINDKANLGTFISLWELQDSTSLVASHLQLLSIKCSNRLTDSSCALLLRTPCFHASFTYSHEREANIRSTADIQGQLNCRPFHERSSDSANEQLCRLHSFKTANLTHRDFLINADSTASYIYMDHCEKHYYSCYTPSSL